MYFAPRSLKPKIRCSRRRRANGGIGAACAKKTMAKSKRLGLTTPDQVLLSLLAEQPMHGYQANLELERRQVRDWAGISRPQVYYSLEKLERLKLVHEAREAKDQEPALGPERRIFSTTAKGREALAAALERED